MKVLQTRIFKRRTKELLKNEKRALDKAIIIIMADPAIGIAKIGDLKGVSVHKYKLSTNQYLLAYTYDSENQELSLLAHGSHENFYRDLKR